MNKSDLIDVLAERQNLSTSVAERIMNEIFGYMAETLIADGRIEIRGFGSFENRVYGSYTGRNPKTGALLTVKPKKSPFFKCGKELKERIMDGGKA